jgi:hypothetical protein
MMMPRPSLSTVTCVAVIAASSGRLLNFRPRTPIHGARSTESNPFKTDIVQRPEIVYC